MEISKKFSLRFENLIKMLSLKESKYPIAYYNTRGRPQIVYYHEENQVEEPEQLEDDTEQLTQHEIDLVYKTIRGTASTMERFPLKALNYYQKAKQDYSQKQGKEITIPAENKFTVIPKEIPNQIQFTLVTGKSGSGKSYWTGQYIDMYHKVFPENPVFIFSKKDDDPAYDCYNYITRIPLDEEFMNTDLDTHQLHDSLCVFDDIENCPRGINEKVHALLDNLSECGRSENCYLVLCNHLSMCGNKTKRSLNESDSVVIFKNSSPYHVKNLLEKHVGLDKRQIDIVMSQKSRWVFINKSEPQYCVTENKVFLL